MTSILNMEWASMPMACWCPGPALNSSSLYTHLQEMVYTLGILLGRSLEKVAAFWRFPLSPSCRIIQTFSSTIVLALVWCGTWLHLKFLTLEIFMMSLGNSCLLISDSSSDSSATSWGLDKCCGVFVLLAAGGSRLVGNYSFSSFLTSGNFKFSSNLSGKSSLSRNRLLGDEWYILLVPIHLFWRSGIRLDWSLFPSPNWHASGTLGTDEMYAVQDVVWALFCEDSCHMANTFA